MNTEPAVSSTNTDAFSISVAPPRPIGSTIWFAHLDRDGMQLCKSKVYDWQEASEAAVYANHKNVEVRVWWKAWVFRLSSLPKALPSQIFSTKEELLSSLSSRNYQPPWSCYCEVAEPDPTNDIEPPLPIGSTVWTWFSNGRKDDLSGKIGETKIYDWQAKPPRHATKNYLDEIKWMASVGDHKSFSHPSHWLFPTKEALLDYLDRTAIDLTNS